jgi:predicted transport protein
MKGGFRESPLRINAGLGQLSSWNEDAIKERASKLSEQAVGVWKSPDLDPAILASYAAAKVSAIGTYSISDHRFLSGTDGKVYTARALFDALREEILALDERVFEEFKKFYIAYKVDTNFVDVVPQAKRLRLMLNLPFIEIKDPKGMCRDVSGLGRWGNGDVEVAYHSIEQLVDVMSLVRQAYEYQMGDAGGQ